MPAFAKNMLLKNAAFVTVAGGRKPLLRPNAHIKHEIALDKLVPNPNPPYSFTRECVFLEPTDGFDV